MKFVYFDSKLFEMKHLAFFLLVAVGHTVTAQVCTYSPDADGDNFIGISDVLQILSLFGTAGDGSGIWCESDEWTYTDVFDCNSPMEVVTGQVPKALVLYHENTAALEFGTYMYENGSEFYGFNYGTIPTSNDDIELYISWPGWTTLPDAYAIEVDVPQSLGGIDDFGNGLVPHVFETVQVGVSDGWVTVVVPQSVMATESSYYSTMLYDINGSPIPSVSTTLNTTISSLQGCYTGDEFAHGLYRMYTSYAGSALNWSFTPNGYLRGGSISE